MKTILSIFFTIGAITCFAQFNLNFEKWVINYNGIDEVKNWMNTSDASEYDAPATMFKETKSPATGLASIKLTTAYWETGSSSGLDTLVGSLIQQSIYTKRPKSFEFSYKSNPKLGDEVLVGIQLTKTINDSIIVLGEGFFTTNQIQKNWTKKKIDINYYSGYTPDNINIIALSSANAAINDGTNGYAKIGSTLYLDNLKLNVEKDITPKSAYYIHVFPNPAKSFINVKTNSPDNQQIEIYNLSGKLVLNSSFNHQSKIDISTLSSGTYVYKVFSALSGEITATNKFNVIR
ncbi:MAG: T9SS type A sorting domain-containing protein [Flavobacteriales bacterium]|nr:T9SS type A sorting domain-containing protein [Flavobacteriales bacterium]